jgi:hypothetical protein
MKLYTYLTYFCYCKSKKQFGELLNQHIKHKISKIVLQEWAYEYDMCPNQSYYKEDKKALDVAMANPGQLIYYNNGIIRLSDPIQEHPERCSYISPDGKQCDNKAIWWSEDKHTCFCIDHFENEALLVAREKK